MKMILRILVLVGITYLHGCATVPMASVENDTARKSFPAPSPGTAGLYIYRNTTLGGSLKKDLYIDGVRVAESAPMTYFYFEVEDGVRKLSTESEFSPNDLIVDVEQGNNYFVQQSIKFGVFVGGADLELVSEEEGKKGVLECKLANNINGDVLIYSGGKINTPVLATEPSPEGEISVFDFYGQAEEEIDTQTYDKNLWDKALVETGGDQNKTKARYIELRADQLYSEKVGWVSLTSLSQQAAPVKPDTPIDISGTYHADITTGGRDSAYWSLGRGPDREVILKQDKDKIVGTFSGSHSGEIEGILNWDRIKFKWFVTEGPTGSESGRGEWKLANDGINWNGTWRSSRGIQGNWNLRRKTD